MEIYSDGSATFAEDSERGTYIIKSGKSFFRPDEDKYSTLKTGSGATYVCTIKDSPAYSIVMSAFILAAILYYFTHQEYRLVDGDAFVALALLIFNIVIHELGHIFALKFFYKDSKTGIGFTMFFIYPAVYVNTSDSYLLPKYKRIAVYLAGCAMNCAFLLVVVLFFPNLSGQVYFIVSVVIMNLLPIVKGDGYNCYLAITGKYKSSKTGKKKFAENFIRGLILFCLLASLSCISQAFMK